MTWMECVSRCWMTKASMLVTDPLNPTQNLWDIHQTVQELDEAGTVGGDSEGTTIRSLSRGRWRSYTRFSPGPHFLPSFSLLLFCFLQMPPCFPGILQVWMWCECGHSGMSWRSRSSPRLYVLARTDRGTLTADAPDGVIPPDQARLLTAGSLCKDLYCNINTGFNRCDL